MKKCVFCLMAALCIIVMQCTDKSPVDIRTYELPMPATASLINRAELGSNGNFTPGYLNGKIRSDRIFLSWQQSKDAHFLAYKVFRNNLTLKTIEDYRVTSLVDSMLTPDTRYLYKVVILIREGTSLSDTLTIKTPKILPPTDINFSILSETSIQLFWTNQMESAKMYEISRRHGAGGIFDSLATVADTFYVDSAVLNNETYTYKLVAKNDFESSAPAQTTITIKYILVPPVLTSLAQVPGSRSVEIKWLDDSNAEEHFAVFRQAQGKDYIQIATVPFNTTSFVDNDTVNALEIGATYSYRLNAFNAKDTTVFSAPMAITIGDPTGFVREGFESGVIPAAWGNAGDAPWKVTSASFSEGSKSAQSGSITHSQSTYMHLSLTTLNPINISFDFKVSSESGYDFLRFLINGSIKSYWSGTVEWQNYSTTIIPSGLVTLEWRYIKDSSQSAGQDAAWIDNIIIR